MMCQECGERPATVHITKIMNNNKEQFSLCEVCAKKHQPTWGFGFEPDFSIHKLLANMLQPESEIERRTTLQSENQCPKCGLSFQEFRETGRLGCDHCYGSFEKSLQPLLRRVHGSLQHGGKIPTRIGGSLKVRREIERLKVKLQEAVRLEEFEEAARLRDKVRELEQEML